MIDEKKHAKLPWKLDTPSFGFGGISDADGNLVFALAAPQARLGDKNHGDIAEASADLIIRAANSHDALVEAVRFVTSQILEPKNSHYTLGDYVRGQGFRLMMEALQKVDAQ